MHKIKTCLILNIYVTCQFSKFTRQFPNFRLFKIKWFIYLSIANLINCSNTILITFWTRISSDLIFFGFSNKRKHGYYEQHWQLLNIWEFFTKMFSDVNGMIKICKRCIIYQKRRRVKIFSNVLDDIWYASILHKLC